MIEVGMALDGGKDSLSMVAKVDGKHVKAPGELVISAYAPCVGMYLPIILDLQVFQLLTKLLLQI